MRKTGPVRAAANRRRGFTFVELTVSATFIVLVLGAVVAITHAVTASWQATEKAQSLQVTSTQASLQIYKLLRSANYVGLATADDQRVAMAGTISSSAGSGAALMFWTEDGSDARIEAAEVTVIEHDRSDNTLKLYQLPKTAPGAATRFLTSDISTSAAVTAFKSIPGVSCRPIAGGVSKVSFKALNTNDSAIRQSVDFQITIERNGQARSDFGTASLRSPIKPDDT